MHPTSSTRLSACCGISWPRVPEQNDPETVFSLSRDSPCQAGCVEVEVTAEADIYRVRDSAGEIKLVEVVQVPEGSDAHERMAALHASGQDQGLAPRADGCNQVSCTEIIHGPGHTTYVTRDSNGDPVHIEVVEHEEN